MALHYRALQSNILRCLAQLKALYLMALYSMSLQYRLLGCWAL